MGTMTKKIELVAMNGIDENGHVQFDTTAGKVTVSVRKRGSETPGELEFNGVAIKLVPACFVVNGVALKGGMSLTKRSGFWSEAYSEEYRASRRHGGYKDASPAAINRLAEMSQAIYDYFEARPDLIEEAYEAEDNAIALRDARIKADDERRMLRTLTGQYEKAKAEFERLEEAQAKAMARVEAAELAEGEVRARIRQNQAASAA